MLFRQVIYNADILANPNRTPLEEKELTDCVEGGHGFAEVFPEHKYEIVTVLQKNGHRVGMTGDGVNDAPALKAADIGIAVADATDAARAASDLVLTSEGLGVIIEAIARSRMIFERMRNYCIYRIACTIQLLFFFFSAMMFFSPAQFIDAHAPVQVSEGTTFQLPVLCLVLITLLNDGCILSIAYDFVQPSVKPSVWKLPELIGIASVIGSIACTGILTLLVLGLMSLNANNAAYEHLWSNLVGLEQPLNYLQLQTLMYLAVSVSGFLVIFIARTRGLFFSRKPGKPLLLATIFALFMSTLISMTDLIGLADGSMVSNPSKVSSGLPVRVVAFVWIWCLLFFSIEDTAKVMFIRFLERNEQSTESGLMSLRDSFWELKESIVATENHARSVVLRQSLALRASLSADQRSKDINRDSILSRNSFVAAKHQTADVMKDVMNAGRPSLAGASPVLQAGPPPGLLAGKSFKIPNNNVEDLVHGPAVSVNVTCAANSGGAGGGSSSQDILLPPVGITVKDTDAVKDKDGNQDDRSFEGRPSAATTVPRTSNAFTTSTLSSEGGY